MNHQNMCYSKDRRFAGPLSCTVVVCTRHRPKQLSICLSAVLRQCHPQFDVLVVDNSPSDPQTAEVAESQGVRRVAEPRCGLSYARNRGAREATGDIVVYIDDDAVPEPGWLQGLSTEFRDSRVFGVVGRILPMNADSEGTRICAAMGLIDGGPERRVIDGDLADWFERLRDGIGIGANMAIRRAAFSVWPGFDPHLGLGAILKGGEEDYAFISLIKRGYRIVYTPSAMVRHPFPETAAELRSRHLETLAASVGFLAFLFAREADLRLTILRHLCRRLPQRNRRSYRPAPAQTWRLGSFWREVLAGVQGLGLFCQAFLGAKDHESLAPFSYPDIVRPNVPSAQGLSFIDGCTRRDFADTRK